MKTKLLAVMMMWLATIGSTVGIATASTDIDWSAKEWLQWNTGVKWIQWVWEENRRGSALLDVIKNAVNWVLWMLSLITLCIVLWWWFQMVTAAGDDGKYKKWFTILKQAWIWLIIILLAWIIVSVVFWLVNSVWWASEAGDGTTK
jgi:hypothetical protein